MTPNGRDRAKRTKAGAATRVRILDAARELVVAEGFGHFTMESVAERAGVSRLTVYYQFGSKGELLEALLDHIAARGRMDRMAEAFRESDPLVGLTRFIEVFCGFWASDPVGIRRLRSWAAVDPGFGAAARDRDSWQREGLQVLIGRLGQRYGHPTGQEATELVDLLHALLSPESYEKVAEGRGPAEVASLLDRAARRLLGLPERADPA